jgi:membrane protease YdiL (CAAX protease family)
VYDLGVDRASALRFFGIYFAVQVVAAVVVTLATPVLTGARDFEHVAPILFGPATLVTAIISGLVVLHLARGIARGRTLEEAFAPIGWRAASRSQIVFAAGVGASLGLASIALGAAMSSAPKSLQFGALASACNALSAVFLAPPIEEFVFRGVLYSGLRRSWSPALSGVVVTLLFALVHGPRIIGLPALLGIAGFGAVALLLRVATDSLAPAITLHAAYNAIVAAARYLSG